MVLITKFKSNRKNTKLRKNYKLVKEQIILLILFMN